MRLRPAAAFRLVRVRPDAVFGFVKGTFIISLASTLGATLAFLLARVVLRERASRVAASNRASRG